MIESRKTKRRERLKVRTDKVAKKRERQRDRNAKRGKETKRQRSVRLSEKR